MRTTIDIDNALMKRAWKLVRPKSKRELIERSLQELIRQEHLKRLAGRVGRMEMIGLREFLRIRRRG